MKTLVIAEAGVNHNGDLATARRLIDAAADAGADLVKFQTFSADRLATASARKADYQRETSGAGETQQAMLRRLELSPGDHEALIAHCKARTIKFFSTGFDIESIDFLRGLGLDRMKVPSGEITNLPYLRHMARFGLPVLMSTGMATMDEISAAVAVMESAGLARAQITVLHCSTEYPTPMEHVNLLAMLAIRDALDVTVGYSDHTQGIEIPIAAVALGARVIEKHFTLDRTMPGPDHRASLEPAELAAMVSAIRNIDVALGQAVKQPSRTEISNMAVVRKSIVASRAIRAGEVLSEQNVTVKRPGTGLSPMRWDDVLGRTAQRDFAADEMIEL